MNKARIFYYCLFMFLVILISSCGPKTSSQIIKDDEVSDQIPKEVRTSQEPSEVLHRALAEEEYEDEDHVDFAEKSVKINPHWTGIHCLTCHDKMPKEGEEATFLFDGDIVKVCNRCHETEEASADIHPVGISVPPEMLSYMPKYFKIEPGNIITCATCHVFTNHTTINNQLRKTNPLFLRGGPYQNRNDICFECHQMECYQMVSQAFFLPAHGGTTPPNAEPYDAVFFENYGVNPFVDTEDDHLSTFAVDVDSASYTIARKYLHDGNVPPDKAIRTEEFINYFDYGYRPPEKETFGIYIEGAPSKFGKNCNLLKIGLKGRKVVPDQRKNAILTFVIDVSGSMQREDRLGLVKKSLRLLVDQLTENDKIGIAIYGSRGEVLMEHKGLNEKTEILLAIDRLVAAGSTFAEEGIRKGYELASKAYKEGYINRIILCSDGVANVGKTGADGILEVIKSYKEKGITLSSIGFGMGNFNDVLLEKLGDKGDGHYAYVDTIAEAKRIFVENLTGTLQVIAKDTKVQVDFNPEVARSYRLLGYENRDVADDKFRDDKEDGGEVGAGHSVTALYEVKFWPDKEGKLATVYIRYKKDETGEVEEVNREITKADFKESFDETSTNFRLAATVAEFAEILKKSYWAKGSDLGDVLTLAQEVLEEKKDDADIIELTDLISKAKKNDEKHSGLTKEDKTKQ